MSTILVGFTPDEYGRAALTHAAAEARQRGYGLLVVNGKGDALSSTGGTPPWRSSSVSANNLAGIDVEVRQTVVADVGRRAAPDRRGRARSAHRARHAAPYAVGKLLMGSVAQRVTPRRATAPCSP